MPKRALLRIAFESRRLPWRLPASWLSGRAPGALQNKPSPSQRPDPARPHRKRRQAARKRRPPKARTWPNGPRPGVSAWMRVLLRPAKSWTACALCGAAKACVFAAGAQLPHRHGFWLLCQPKRWTRSGARCAIWCLTHLRLARRSASATSGRRNWSPLRATARGQLGHLPLPRPHAPRHSALC